MTTLLALTIGTHSIVSFLVWLLVAALVIYCVFLVLNMLPLPAPVKQIVTVIIAIICLFLLLQHLGIAL